MQHRRHSSLLQKSGHSKRFTTSAIGQSRMPTDIGYATGRLSIMTGATSFLHSNSRRECRCRLEVNLIETSSDLNIKWQCRDSVFLSHRTLSHAYFNSMTIRSARRSEPLRRNPNACFTQFYDRMSCTAHATIISGRQHGSNTKKGALLWTLRGI